MSMLEDDAETLEAPERRANSAQEPLLHSTLRSRMPSRQSRFISQLTSTAG